MIFKHFGSCRRIQRNFLGWRQFSKKLRWRIHQIPQLSPKTLSLSRWSYNSRWNFREHQLESYYNITKVSALRPHWGQTGSADRRTQPVNCKNHSSRKMPTLSDADAARMRNHRVMYRIQLHKYCANGCHQLKAMNKTPKWASIVRDSSQ